MGRLLYSAFYWAVAVLSSAVLFVIALLVWALTLPIDPQKRLLHRFTCFWASLYTWLNPAWPVHIVGRAKIRSDRATIMVANHLSLLDILVLFRTFAYFKWVSKIENFRIPFIGWNMSLNGYIKLRRGDHDSVLQMMEACENVLARGSSIMMFPEGTRSPTGRMRDFKSGAFELALSTRSPVQPIVIRGTGEALPKRGFVMRGRHPIRIAILDPIPPESFEQLSAPELTEQVRTLIAEALGEAV